MIPSLRPCLLGTVLSIALASATVGCGSAVQELGDNGSNELDQRGVPGGDDTSANGEASIGSGADNQAASNGPGAGTAGPTALPITKLSVGEHHSCALRGGEAWCWGSGDGLSRGGTFDAATGKVHVSITDLVDISAGRLHTCAVQKGGATFCWGSNGTSQLGDGTKELRYGAVRVTAVNDAEASFVKVVAGYTSSCGLRASGLVSCWGLIPGGTTPPPFPAVPSMDLISGSNGFTCGRAAPGVQCWGDTSFGVSGTGNTAGGGPVQYASSADLANAKDISAGVGHVCVALQDGQVRCWGRAENGQLGPKTPTPAPTQIAWPTLVPGIADAVGVATGELHSCALRANGTVWCWGANTNGELGDGTKASRKTPAEVVGLSGVTALAAGWHSTCAVRNGTEVLCWGRNDSNKIGTVTSGGDFPLPTPVKPF